jgi:hypothetical protein
VRSFRIRNARARATSSNCPPVERADNTASTSCTFFPDRSIPVVTVKGDSGTGRTSSTVNLTVCTATSGKTLFTGFPRSLRGELPPVHRAARRKTKARW